MSDVIWQKFKYENFLLNHCDVKSAIVKSEKFVDEFNPSGVLFGSLVNSGNSMSLYASVWDEVNDSYRGITLSDYDDGGSYRLYDIDYIAVLK